MGSKGFFYQKVNVIALQDFEIAHLEEAVEHIISEGLLVIWFGFFA